MTSATRQKIRQRAPAASQGLHPIRDAATVAMIVVDLQNAFVEPAEALAGPFALGILPGVGRLAAAVRAAGGTLVWTRHTWSDEPAFATPLWFRHLVGAGTAAALRRLQPGSHPHAVHGSLAVEDGDILIDKYRPSAFLPDHARLDAQLRGRGIHTVIVCGTVTSFCCQSTARDALMLDYRVCFPPDLNAGSTEQGQQATLADLSNMGLFDMRGSEALLGELESIRA